jgi:hypothetical protein
MSIFNQNGAQSSDRKFYYGYISLDSSTKTMTIDGIPFQPKRIDGYAINAICNPPYGDCSAFCWNNSTFCQTLGYDTASYTGFTVDVSQNTDKTYKAVLTSTDAYFCNDKYWRIFASNVSGWGN